MQCICTINISVKKVPSLGNETNDGTNVRANYAANANNKGTIFPSIQAL